MKNFLIALLSFVGFLLMTAPAATVIAQKLHVSPILIESAIVLITLAAYKLYNAPKLNAFTAGVEVEVWANYIIERLWKENTFLNHTFNDDQYVLAGKVVHIPQPGSKPDVVKNRTTFPAVAVGRTDGDVNYSLDVYTTDPTHIQDAEKVELSYDKIDSVFGDHAGALAETIGDDLIIKWLTGIGAGSKALTTGAAAAATADSATGTRKVITIADFKRMQKVMNKQNIMKTDRFAMLTSDMLDQLTSELTQTQYRDFSQYFDASKGVVGKLFGFDILERSNVATSNAAGVVKAFGTAAAVTDCEVGIFWQKNAVARALGEKKFFENINDSTYYGDVYSSLVRMGGRRRRSDDKGIIMMYQDTVS